MASEQPHERQEREEQAEQIKALLTPNLEYAALCVESARQVALEWDAAEHLDVLSRAIEHSLHFLHLARAGIAQLQDLQATPEQTNEKPTR